VTSPKLAARLLEAQEWEPAMAALLDAWRAHRVPVLAEAIAALSDFLAPAVEPVEGEGDAWEQAWQRRVEARRPAQLGVLLPGLTAAPKSQIRRRLRAVLECGPDPRIGALLVSMIEEPPLTASSQFGTWSELFAALPEHVDASVIPRLEARMATRGGKSQFWTKLDAWITAVIPKLAPPAKLPGAWKPELTGLRKTLKGLAKLPPPSLAGAAPVAVPAAIEHAAVDSLASARAALEAGELELALDRMVGYWAGCRSPELAAWIERLGLIVDADKPGPGGKTKKDRQAAWLAAAQHPAPHTIGPLLASLRDAQLADVEIRVAALAEWQPDPRVAQAMMQLVHDIMLGARDGLWRAVYAALVAHADPRTAADLHARHARLEHANVAHRHICEGRAIRARYEQLTAALAGEHRLTADQAEHGEAIAAKLAALVDASDDEDAAAIEQRMVAAILADWDDDGPRLVYSDWLQARQDPRGEFIALDLALAAGKRVKGAREKYFKAHKQALFGPLAPVLTWGEEFERGLLVGAKISTRRGALDLAADARAALFDDLRWACVRELQVSHDDLGVRELFERAPLAGLRTLSRPSLTALQGFAARREPLGLRELYVSGSPDDSDADWAAFGQLASVLPEVELLSIMIWAREGGRETPPLACFCGELVRRAKLLRNGSDTTGSIPRIDEWLERVGEARCPVPRLEFIGSELSAQIEQVELGRFRVALRVRRLFANRRETPIVLAVLRGLPRERIVGVELETDQVDEGVMSELEAALAGLR
jgi:uncharacterized protein (TIGR02996 family)